MRVRAILAALTLLILGHEVVAQRPAGAEPRGEAKAAAPRSRPRPSEAARAALAGAKEIAGRIKGLADTERPAAIETAARAYDKVALDFVAEPTVAAQAAFTAADLWRRHGSHALAEQGYLMAARVDPEQYGQRGTIAAADMQRHLDRNDEALSTYAKVVAMDPGTSRAQTARLWQGRLQQQLGRLDDAVATFRAALEAAEKPRQVIDTVNCLARALIERGDLDGAANAIRHAEEVVAGAVDSDPIETERLRKLVDTMSARKALQRARDKKTAAARDAQDLEKATGR